MSGRGPASRPLALDYEDAIRYPAPVRCCSLRPPSPHSFFSASSPRGCFSGGRVMTDVGESLNYLSWRLLCTEKKVAAEEPHTHTRRRIQDNPMLDR